MPFDKKTNKTEFSLHGFRPSDVIEYRGHVPDGMRLVSGLGLISALLLVCSLVALIPAPVNAEGSITIYSEDGPRITIRKTGEMELNRRRETSKANSLDERCGPNDLRDIDRELNNTYLILKRRLSERDADQLRKEQLTWIRERDKECEIEYQGNDMEKWLGHVLMEDSRKACVKRVTSGRTAQMKRKLRKAANIHYAKAGEQFNGVEQEEWVERYWKWVRQYSRGNSPSADSNGRLCGIGQSGGVWFLTGSVSQNRVERSCSISEGTALVLPALNINVQSRRGAAEAEGARSPDCDKLMKKAAVGSEAIKDIYFRVDGIDYTDQALNSVSSDCFTLDDKRLGYETNAVGAGYWAFIDALPPGEHRLEFGGEFSDGFRQEIVYNLTVKENCSLPLEKGEAEIVAVGRYRGLHAGRIQLGGSGHETRISPVVVNRPGKPVVLVLSAYDPTWWKVSWTPGTRIKAVILSGYHSQAVTGISRDIPLILSSYEKKGSCPRIKAYRAGRDMDTAITRIKSMTGQSLDKVVLDPSGDRFVVGADDYKPDSLISSSDYSLEDFDVKYSLPAGEEGLQQLIVEGKLRPATRADIQKWVDAASRKYSNLNKDLKVRTYMYPFNTYVVLKKMEVPSGMYGGNSRSFLIPADVPKPEDKGSHNTYYYIETGTCSGTAPDCL